MKIFVVAEAGVNHNGNIKIAKKMIDAAVWAGADAVKFQAFKADKLASLNAPKAEYQKKHTRGSESQLDMLKKLELDFSEQGELLAYAKKKRIIFLSSPFDLESIDLLNRLGLGILKIPSGELTNLPYLKKIGSLKKKLILSTGMANLKEVKEAVRILTGSGTLKSNICVLQCVTSYPAKFEDANLRAMLTIRDNLDVKVGYSDHTPGIYVSVAAVALGAEIIEKHFTLDRRMLGPDQKASIEPKELRQMVEAIGVVGMALGTGLKKPSSCEIPIRAIARKSIVAASAIKKGDYFSQENLAVKRPGTGVSPMQWNRVVGKRAKKDFQIDELIKL